MESLSGPEGTKENVQQPEVNLYFMKTALYMTEAI